MLPEFFPYSLPEPSRHLRINATVGGAEGLMLAGALARARANKEQNPIVVFCDSSARIEQWKKQLEQLQPDIRLLSLPDWETLPYDRLSPHKDLMAERVRALSWAIKGQYDVLLVSVASALTRLSPRHYFDGRSFEWWVGETLSREAFIKQLVESGYHTVSQVLGAGEWASRGGIIDVFPMGSVAPLRIEWADDRIESLRLFDVDSQRTLYSVQHLSLLPAREFPFDDESINRFRRSFREHVSGNYAAHPLYKQVSAGTLFAGAEYFLPWWVERTDTLFDYLPAGCVCWLDSALPPWEEAFQSFWSLVGDTYARHRHDPEWPILPPDEVFVPPALALEHLSRFARISFNTADNAQSFYSPLPAALIDERMSPIERILSWRNSAPMPMILMAETIGRRHVWEDRLTQAHLPFRVISAHSVIETIAAELSDETPAITLMVAEISPGFISPSVAGLPALCWVSENALLPNRQGGTTNTKRGSEGAHKIEQWIRDLSELQEGDLVVHQHYGIGRYCGLIRIPEDDGEGEYLHVAYADSAKLYVPVTQLHLIGRYGGSPDSAAQKLHSLSGNDWDKARTKAEAQARDTAAELLSLYALRQAQESVSVRAPKLAWQCFSEGFGFELTPDQHSAINAVLSDMAGETVMGITNIKPINHPEKKPKQADWKDSRRKPMDRLVCGDVGFGKTEVALRSAFVAVANGFQVAMLCPTTLLAEQHTATFQDRFAQFVDDFVKINLTPEMADSEVEAEQLFTLHGRPINIVGLSRFRSAAEQKQMLAELAKGQIDVVIGTHRLLQSDVSFARLGLIIIDEEHRFGVRHKEALKRMRANAHVLTLTATPIPRTLSLSMEGLRDFSVMSTPPSRRLSVKTLLVAPEDSTIREACAREFRRGGQIFFLHNEVSTINLFAERLQKIVPEARIAVAHGQMGEQALERVMRDFRHQQFNVLLCSTIIENGIDIPNANTIFIHKAQNFGIAQLHQLRGRVGRSHHQAYCYLLVDSPNTLPRQAKQRLEAICDSDELGAGFYLAMHDLEIRGAGEFLGEAQSGAMAQVGFDLYTQMLHRAVNALKKEQGQSPDTTMDEAPFAHPEDINLHCSALLPNDYCADVHERLKLYKRLANAAAAEEIQELRDEIIDRFGLLRDGHLPKPVETLMAVHRLRLRSRPLGIHKIHASADTVECVFHAGTPLSPTALIKLLRQNKHWQLKGENRLLVKAPSVRPNERIERVQAILTLIESAISS